jgi:16S rRNA processing protein RimM
MRRRQPEPRYLAVGRVQRPHGVHGELRLEILTGYPERLAQLDVVYVGRECRRYAVTGCRLHRDIALVQLGGVDDRNSADDLRGQIVYVAIEDAVPLDEHEVYEFQAEGLQVVTEEGLILGDVAEVLAVPGANEVFVVRGPRGEILIPVIEDVIIDVNLDAGRLVIHAIPGLLDNV